MKRLLSALLLLCAVAPVLRADSPVGVEAAFPTPMSALVSFEVPSGHHLYRDSIRVELRPGGAVLATNALPAATAVDEIGGPSYDAPFSAVFTHTEPFPEGATLAVSFQDCGPTMCYPPETRSFSLPGATVRTEEPQVAPAPPAEAPADDFRLPSLDDFRIVRTLAGRRSSEEYLAFLRGEAPRLDPLARARERGGIALVVLALLLGGFLLNLTPCVLPLVPVNLALLGAGLGRASRRRGALLGAAFGLGTALAFGALGLAAALAGRSFGFLQGSVTFNAAVAAVFCVLAFAMLDALRLDFSGLRNAFRKPGRAGAAPRAASGAVPFVRAFLAGAGAALLSGACVAPVLVSALVLAADLVRGGHPAGALVPFVLGLGMGLPWPFLGAGVAALPKPGRWMERVKQLFAVVFLVAAAHYAWNAWTLLFPTVPEEPRAGSVAWMTDEAAAAIFADKAGVPLLVSLGADWCRECHEMDRTVFVDPAVTKEIEAGFPAALRLDCTASSDPAVRRVMELLGAPGLPFSAVLVPKETQK